MLSTPTSFARMPAVRYLLGTPNIKCPELNSLPSASDLLLPCTPGSGLVHPLPNYTATWSPLSFPIPVTATRSTFRCFSSPSISLHFHSYCRGPGHHQISPRGQRQPPGLSPRLHPPLPPSHSPHHCRSDPFTPLLYKNVQIPQI